MARTRFQFGFPLLFALFAGLGALTPSFPSQPPPPALNREMAPPPAQASPGPAESEPAPTQEDISENTAPV